MLLWLAGAVIIYFVVVSLLRKLILPNLGSKYVFITGCDTGFGNLLAKKLDKMGLNVIAGCFTDKGETELIKSCSRKLKTVHIDVTSEESISKAVVEVTRLLPSGKGLWAVVNNAGVGGSFGPIEWTSKEDFIRTLDVNLYGVILVSKAFMPLIRRESGRVVNMSSMTGRYACVSATYVVSKYGVEGFSDVLRSLYIWCVDIMSIFVSYMNRGVDVPRAYRHELYTTGVSVHIIEPGFFATPLLTSLNRETMTRYLRERQKKQPRETADTYDHYVNRVVDKTEKAVQIGDPNLNKVVDAYTHAITARFPKARYIVGKDAQFIIRVLANLPEWLGDYILTKL